VIAFVFPGQGAQVPGMLCAAAVLPGAAAVIAQAGAALGRDLLADDTAAGYAANETTQRALYVAGIASARALIAAGVQPDAVAGHSVGAYAAAVIAGALDFDDGLALVDARGRAMAAAFPAGYGMGAISGLDEPQVAALAARVAQRGEPVYAANVNARDQIVVAGAASAVDATLAAAQAAGARSARRLNVDVPSHSPLMNPVVAVLDHALPAPRVTAARIPYAANISGRLVRDARRIRADLVGNIAHPVRWADATDALYEMGIRLFIEMRPGRVLTDLAAANFPDARAIALETSGLDSAIALAATQ
jgi:malonate decarboxylase epsilon subunit